MCIYIYTDPPAPPSCGGYDAVSLCHCVAMSQCHCVNASQCHSDMVSLFPPRSPPPEPRNHPKSPSTWGAPKLSSLT